MVRRLLAVVVAVFSLSLLVNTATTSAHVFKFHPALAKRSLTGRASGQRLVIWHDRMMINLLCSQRSRVINLLSAEIKIPPDPTMVRACYFHRAQLRWTRRELAETLRAIQSQRRTSLSVPASFYSQAMCVHRGEGAWNANTGNGFGGGLQFMVGTWNGAARYSGGRVPHVKKTGDIARQKPSVQIYAAYIIVVREHAGWGQWPNTARVCGLI